MTEVDIRNAIAFGPVTLGAVFQVQLLPVGRRRPSGRCLSNRGTRRTEDEQAASTTL